MSIEEQALRVLDNRCRYCGVAPDELHHKHCNVLIAQRLDDLISNLTYAMNDLSRKVENVSRDVHGVGELISQNLSNYDLFVRHRP